MLSAERSKPMGIQDIIIIAVVVLIVGVAAWYIYKSKKNGKKCIGCPDGCACSSKEGGCSCGCGGCQSE